MLKIGNQSLLKLHFGKMKVHKEIFELIVLILYININLRCGPVQAPGHNLAEMSNKLFLFKHILTYVLSFLLHNKSS